MRPKASARLAWALLAFFGLQAGGCGPAYVAPGFQVQVGHLGGEGQSRKRAFLQVQPVVLKFHDEVRSHTFYWAVIVMERDGNDEPRDDFDIDPADINTAWVNARSSGPEDSRRVSHDELLRVADVKKDATERPVVFTRDADRFSDGGLPGPYIVLHNPDCPGAETAHPTKNDHCEGTSNGPDDIVALIGAGSTRPNGRSRVVLPEVLLHFDDNDIPIVPNPAKEYYAMIVLYDSTVESAVRIFRSPITFSELH